MGGLGLLPQWEQLRTFHRWLRREVMESIKACVALKGWREVDNWSSSLPIKNYRWSNGFSRNQVQNKQKAVAFQTTESHSVNFLTKGFCASKDFNTVQGETSLGSERFCGLPNLQIIVDSGNLLS